MINNKSENGTTLRIELNFSKYAHVYDKHAQLQKLMAEKLASFLPNDMPEQILEIGCGTGLLLNTYSLNLLKKYFLMIFPIK